MSAPALRPGLIASGIWFGRTGLDHTWLIGARGVRLGTFAAIDFLSAPAMSQPLPEHPSVLGGLNPAAGRFKAAARRVAAGSPSPRKAGPRPAQGLCPHLSASLPFSLRRPGPVKAPV